MMNFERRIIEADQRRRNAWDQLLLPLGIGLVVFVMAILSPLIGLCWVVGAVTRRLFPGWVERNF